MIIAPWDETFNTQIEQIEKDCFKTPWTLNMLEAVSKSNNFCGLVMLDGEKVVGYIGSIYTDWDVDILNVAVVREYRRQKIAETLLCKLIGFYMNNGKEKIFLEVRKSNEIAQKLYKKLGFSQVSIRKKYYENTEDAVIMQKLLRV